MFDELVFRSAVDQLNACAIHANEEARKRRELGVANWLLNAAVNRALGISPPPKPPEAAQVMKVTVPAGETKNQDTIVVSWGPEPVSDLACELTPAAVPVLPQGVTAVGHDYGHVFAALDNDTMPNGAKVHWKRAGGESVILLKHFTPWHADGALFAKVDFYEVVKE